MALERNNKCEHCGEMFMNYGFAAHIRACKKLTNEQRQAAHERRMKYSPTQSIDVTKYELNGKRVRITVSVDLNQLKMLLPHLEIDKLEIS